MLATVDLVRVGISIAVAILLCTLRLRLVLWTDTIYSVVAGGFTVYYANEALRQSCQPSVVLDAQHEFLLQTRVALLLMPSFTWFFCRTTVDITCRTALTLSRLVVYLFAGIFMAVDHFRLDIFTEFHLMYCMLPCLLWVVVMGVQLVRTGSRVNIHIRRVDINRFLSIDLLFLLLLAMIELVLPPYIGPYVGCQVDTLHAYLHRINGCTYLGLAIIPWIGQRFRYSEDKHTILLARLICLLMWYGGVGFCVWKEVIPMALSTYVFLGQQFVLFFPALIGIIICQSGPFTAAFWSSQRKAVSINHQRSVGAQQRPQ